MNNAKVWPALLAVFLTFFISQTQAYAELFINEFASDTEGTIADPDWVEIYNSGVSSIDLSDYRLEDFEATNKKCETAGGIAKRNNVPRLQFMIQQAAGLDRARKYVLSIDPENTIDGLRVSTRRPDVPK